MGQTKVYCTWFFFGYSLAPNMVEPILTLVLPISICKDWTYMMVLQAMVHKITVQRNLNFSPLAQSQQTCPLIAHTEPLVSPGPYTPPSCNSSMSACNPKKSGKKEKFEEGNCRNLQRRSCNKFCYSSLFKSHLKIFWSWGVIQHSYCHQTREYKIWASILDMLSQLYATGWLDTIFCCRHVLQPAKRTIH